jgi:hypothetical protein
VFPGLSIRFGLDGNSDGVIDTDAVFEQAGTFPGEAPNSGFAGSSGNDTADPGFALNLAIGFSARQLEAPILVS